MKKLLAMLVVLALALAVCANAAAAAADDGITVMVNGWNIDFPDLKPFVDENGRTLAPLRPIGEALGLEVAWQEESQEASFSRAEDTEKGPCRRSAGFTIGSEQYVVMVSRVDENGEWVKDQDQEFTVLAMDTKARLVEGRTCVPVRYLVEAFGFTVAWDAGTRTITVASAESGAAAASDVVNPPVTTPASPARQFDMSDPNVQKRPIYATTKTPEELAEANPKGVSGRWRSATEIIESMKRPDNFVPVALAGREGVNSYDWGMKPVQEWVDNYLVENGLTYEGKTDYEKTAIIRQLCEDGGNNNGGRLEEFIGLSRPNFRFGNNDIGDCVSRSDAVYSLMIAMDFRLFSVVNCTVGTAHATNAYWDPTAEAVRFVDGNLSGGVWNLFVDELDEKGFILD
jgi:opacity protein-like surface antigen